MEVCFFSPLLLKGAIDDGADADSVRFRDVESHMAFAKTKDFEEYAEIREYLLIEKTEIRHVALMELPPAAAA